jgi:hypothetical protein
MLPLQIALQIEGDQFCLQFDDGFVIVTIISCMWEGKKLIQHRDCRHHCVADVQNKTRGVADGIAKA